MNRDKNWMQALLHRTELPSEALPGQPVIELMGDRRVLIENHLSVVEYGQEKICVRVRYGQVQISGANLELAQMRKGQLVVVGRIDSIQLVRRGRK